MKLETHEYVCDCGRTKVIIEEPAEYPYGDARDVQCTECGTYVKEYAVHVPSGGTRSPYNAPRSKP